MESRFASIVSALSLSLCLSLSLSLSLLFSSFAFSSPCLQLFLNSLSLSVSPPCFLSCEIYRVVSVGMTSLKVDRLQYLRIIIKIDDYIYIYLILFYLKLAT